MFISKNSTDEKIASHSFVLTYFESRAIKPYDKLILNDTEYQIYPGLKIEIKKEMIYKIISKDISSYRVYKKQKIGILNKKNLKNPWISWIFVNSNKKAIKRDIITAGILLFIYFILESIVRLELYKPEIQYIDPEIFKIVRIISEFVSFEIFYIIQKILLRKIKVLKYRKNIDNITFRLRLLSWIIIIYSSISGVVGAGWTFYELPSTTQPLISISILLQIIISLLNYFLLDVEFLNENIIHIFSLALIILQIYNKIFFIKYLIFYLSDFNFGTEFLKVDGGDDPILLQYLYWFFSHDVWSFFSHLSFLIIYNIKNKKSFSFNFITVGFLYFLISIIVNRWTYATSSNQDTYIYSSLFILISLIYNDTESGQYYIFLLISTLFSLFIIMPKFFLGLMGMPIGYPDYPYALTGWNSVVSLSTWIFFLYLIIYIFFNKNRFKI